MVPMLHHRSQVFQSEDSGLLHQISVLEDELRSLRLKYAEALSDNTILQNMITDRDTVINDIIFTRKAKKEAIEILDAKPNQNIARNHEEDIFMSNDHYMEVKYYREVMESIQNKHQDLERKFSKLSKMYEAKTVSPPSSSELIPLNKCMGDARISFQADEAPILSEVSRFCVIESACYETSSNSLNGESSSPTATGERFMRNSANITEGNTTCDLSKMSPSLVTHWATLKESQYSNNSIITSFIPHYVGLLGEEEAFDSSGDLFQRLEAQFQKERREACRQS